MCRGGAQRRDADGGAQFRRAAAKPARRGRAADRGARPLPRAVPPAAGAPREARARASRAEGGALPERRGAAHAPAPGAGAAWSRGRGEPDPRGEAPGPGARAGAPGAGRRGGGTPRGQKPLPESLPRVEIEVLPEEVKREGLDAFERIGEETSELIERRPASLVVVRTIRPKFVRKDRERGVETRGHIAELPELPIERGLAGPGGLAATR